MGALIVNADDWGMDSEATNRALECARRGAVSAVSAMVFMADSVRGAELALEHSIDVGLHLNLTSAFTAQNVPSQLARRHEQISRFLRSSRYSSVFYHPGLARNFEYVIASQIEEFSRLYGMLPARIDGHHHMHLCANVLWGRLLPSGGVVRPNFSFRPGEKGFFNLLYRNVTDKMLRRRHRTAGNFMSLPPITLSRLERMIELARTSIVEIETHPANIEEYKFLVSGELLQLAVSSGVTVGYDWRRDN